MVNQSQITYLTIEVVLDEPESLTAQSLTLPVHLVILEAQKREVGRSSMARLGAKTRAAAINHLIQNTGIDTKDNFSLYKFSSKQLVGGVNSKAFYDTKCFRFRFVSGAPIKLF